MDTPAPETLTRLERVIADRSTGDAASSYVARLLADAPALPARKLGEEAVETVVAALSGSRAELTSEAADLLFHLLVLLRANDVPLADVLAELDRRDGLSGLDEKAARQS
ncbi:MAG: phosphoribosyl-ATP diphosphatase [Parerythrobacter sp.]